MIAWRPAVQINQSCAFFVCISFETLLPTETYHTVPLLLNQCRLREKKTIRRRHGRNIPIVPALSLVFQCSFVSPWQQVVRVPHLRRRSPVVMQLSAHVPRRDPSLERPQPDAPHHFHGHRAETYGGLFQGERDDDPQQCQPNCFRDMGAAASHKMCRVRGFFRTHKQTYKYNARPMTCAENKRGTSAAFSTG